MSKMHNFFQLLFSASIILSLGFSVARTQSAAAQGGDGIKRQTNAENGKVSFISPENGRVVSASKALGSFVVASDPALALARRFAPEFGLKNPERDLSLKENKHLGDGRVMARYQQNYEGIPVLGGELIVNTNENGDLYSMNGEVSSLVSLQTQPMVDSEQAKQTALQAIAKGYQMPQADFLVSEPELWIFDESLLLSSTRPVELVWRMDVMLMNQSVPLRELVLVNALKGNISLHFNQIDSAWHSYGSDSTRERERNSNNSDVAISENTMALTFSPDVSTYTANSTASLPGSFICNQSKPNCTNGSDPHADAAHKYAIGTFNMYDAQHNRNSIDNKGMKMISTVHYCDNSEPFPQCPYGNAFWSGDQMVYGDAYGFPLADDVVAHELTHGVTQYESSLFYYYQSGAINESFSDLWGEYYDQANNQGTDTPGVKWQIGEDVAGYGALRSMSDPASFGDPDKMSSSNYYEFDDDNGGVHHNSGLNNKAVFLMVDGGTFNGKTVTALGWVKTIAIYYEAQTNLLISGSDYSDLYYILQQACSNLVGQKGITSANCQEVKDAVDAVEMNAQPSAGFNTDAPLCSNSSTLPNIIFADDIEAGTSNWTFTSTPSALHWQVDSSLYGQYAQSGIHSLYADDVPAEPTDASARLAGFVVPSNAYMHFAQAYGFEVDFFFGDYYDGGVLEYSTNGGGTWRDAGSLIDYNGYKGTIFTGADNPLSGRSAFVGASHGYIGTRLNLASLAGQTVTFRWRMGLDAAVSAWGWWVDNVKVYTCSAHNLNVFIGGTLMNSYYVASERKVTVNYGINNGPVYVASTTGMPIFASERAVFGDSFNSIVGYPGNQLTTDYWFTSYDDVGMTTFLVIGNPSTSQTAQVNVYIGGNKMNATPYSIPPGGRIFPRYGINGGPVFVDGINGVNVFASERTKFGNRFNEIMGYPANRLTTDYWFTSYDDVGMITYLVIGNPSTSQTAQVDVYIGGNKKNPTPISIAPGQRTFLRYGVNGGPVFVDGLNGVNVFASERTKFGNTFNEVMGYPANRLTTDYWFTSYDDAGMITYLVIGNPHPSQTAQVDVYMAGVKKNATPYSIAPGQRIFLRYGLNSGPVKVMSTNGVNIFASERSKYLNSFNEILGIAGNQLTTDYWFTSYDDVGMNTELIISAP